MSVVIPKFSPEKYAQLVRNSERVAWAIDDVLPPGATLDFSRPFLPESLVDVAGIEGLEPALHLRMNHVIASGYLNLFAFVEEYIIAMASEHAQAALFGDRDELRALLRFSEEEVKHQLLFRRFLSAFEAGFGRIQVLDNSVEVAGLILDKTSIAVLLITLHIEIVTQYHFTSAVRDAGEIDPLFESLLRNHWLEEAQHAKIDRLLLAKRLLSATTDDRLQAVDEYTAIVRELAGLLDRQAALDVDTVGVEGEAQGIVDQVASRYRRVFLSMGMTHPEFLDALDSVSPQSVDLVLDLAHSL